MNIKNEIIFFRVLYLAMSPDGQTVVTGAGDETLRFWSVFPRHGNNRTGTFSWDTLQLSTDGPQIR